MNTFSRFFVALLLAFTMLLPALAGPEPMVSLLEKEGNPRIGPGAPPAYLEVLEKNGILVGYPDDKKVMPLTWDKLRQYHMVIISALASDYVQNGPVVSNEAAETEKLLDRFLQEGGGVLYIGQPILTPLAMHDGTNAWLKQYGAQFDWAIVEDPEHTYKTPPTVPWQRPQYLWTTNIAASPITQGVKTLFFPNDVYYCPQLRPLQVNGDWQVLVRAMPTASAWKLTPTLNAGIPKKIDGGNTVGAQTLIAVRQVGKGRLALFGADPGPFYYDLGKPVGAQVCSMRGDGERPSDWLKLLRNLCVWLSEPAREAGFPGGVKERVKTYINPEYGNREPIDWDRPDIALPDYDIVRLYGMHAGAWDVKFWREVAAGYHKPFRFLVGAHTVRSGGHGTVAEWKAAAKQAGFDGIVFREQILTMRKEQWETFEAECKAASDDAFLAIPGQEFTDWEGNRFMRFNRTIPYFHDTRLTADKKTVKDQLAFFFDAGWPANFPISVKSNPTAFWNYRVYSALPVAVYQGGKQIEDNHAEWASLVARMEYPTPLGIHLLEDPSEVAGTQKDMNLVLMAPSLADIRDNPRWAQSPMGTGMHNIAIAYASDGPAIDAFLPINHYRATLGQRELPGTDRYRIVVRAHSDVPLARVELWGGDQCLRSYQPKTTSFFQTIDDLHDEQRGLWLKVVDSKGREALATSIMVHDKMMAFYWCGDHCNMLPYGQGVDANGNPSGNGLQTHVKSMFQAGGGPAASFGESAQYIPYGTDTSAPGLGLTGELTFNTANGPLPTPNVHYVPDIRFWYGNRDVIITRMDCDRYADRNKYSTTAYGPYISGWGPYFKTQPTEDFDILADDIDLQHDAGQPAFQLCRGTVKFKREVSANGKQILSLVLNQLGWNQVKSGLSTAQGPVAQPGRVEGKLGAGNYLTWTGEWNSGTVFALDDNFAAAAYIDAKGAQQGRPGFGYMLDGRTFKPGETFRYQFLIMRWPGDVPASARLDAKVQTALNLVKPDSGVKLTASQGAVVGTRFLLDLQAQKGAFRGVLAPGNFGLRAPVRISGLNANWTSGLWVAARNSFIPVGLDPEGYAWTSVDPAKDAGPLFLGNVLSCEQPGVYLRLLPRNDGWEVVANNPLAKSVTITVRGAAGGPVDGLSKKLTLAPGAEVKWLVKK
ncbi:MAG TPA: hypothetical protein VGM23_08930 [Armatimonadota bacterium]